MESLTKLVTQIPLIFLQKKETIAVVESVTSGFLQLMFSQMQDASSFYCGGITAYTLKVKTGLLKINKQEALIHNCVSQKITEDLCLNGFSLFKSDWVIAVTGYATPVKESKYKLYAYYSIAREKEILKSDKIEIMQPFSPLKTQFIFSRTILHQLNKLLKEEICANL